MSPIVVLVGPPGAGKSTVGRKLAAKRHVAFLDTDSAIEAQAGMTVAEIFSNLGEGAFRDLESEVLAKSLEEHDGVLSLGGGAVIRPDNRTALKGHRVVWLDLPTRALWRRLSTGRPRPLMMGMSPEGLEALLAERQPWYEEVATWRVESTEGSPDKPVAAIERLLDAA